MVAFRFTASMDSSSVSVLELSPLKALSHRALRSSFNSLSQMSVARTMFTNTLHTTINQSIDFEEKHEMETRMMSDTNVSINLFMPPQHETFSTIILTLAEMHQLFFVGKQASPESIVSVFHQDRPRKVQRILFQNTLVLIFHCHRIVLLNKNSIGDTHVVYKRTKKNESNTQVSEGLKKEVRSRSQFEYRSRAYQRHG